MIISKSLAWVTELPRKKQIKPQDSQEIPHEIVKDVEF